MIDYMLLDYIMGVWNKGPNTKVNGVTYPGIHVWVKDINVDIQPYSTGLLIRKYGYDIQVNKRIFAELDTDIKTGTILKYTNKQNEIESYEVRKIIPWENDMEIMAMEL